MLDRQGIVMKLRRLYRGEKLQVRRRGGRKRTLGTRRPMLGLSLRAEEKRGSGVFSLNFRPDLALAGPGFCRQAELRSFRHLPPHGGAVHVEHGRLNPMPGAEFVDGLCAGLEYVVVHDDEAARTHFVIERV